MIRSIALAVLVCAAGTVPGLAQQNSATPAGTHTITVVLPSLKSFYDDLKVPFDLAEDPKGYETLIDTLEVFVVGLERDKPLGLRMLSSPAGGLHANLSLPVKGAPGDAKADPQYQKLRENLWDLDLKTAPPPDPRMIRLVPPTIRTRLPGLKLGAAERLMFGGRDGYMRRETDVVHMGVELADVRSFKGGIPFDFPAGIDLGVRINGQAQPAADRQKAFAKLKGEMSGASKKKADEAATAFALRDGVYQQLLAELERFFVENSEILGRWTLDNSKRNAAFQLDLAALPNTDLATSVETVRPSANPYALVKGDDAAIRFTSQLTLDSLRKKHAGELAKLVKAHVADLIDGDAQRDAPSKDADKQALNLLFEAMADVATQAELTGCLRSWETKPGYFDTLGALKIADQAKYADMLKQLAGLGGALKVDLDVETVGGVTLHKIAGKSLQNSLPEFISADGTVWIGLGPNVLWYASGDGVQARLKAAIAEAQAANAPEVAPLQVAVRMGPLARFGDSYRKRNPAPAKPKATPAAKPAPKADGEGSKKPVLARGNKEEGASPLAQLTTLLGEMNLQALATQALQGKDDTLAVSLTREGDKARVDMQADTGLLRFVGKAVSKFVKDNLSDE